MVSAIALANGALAADFEWMLRYSGRLTNELIWDSKMEQTYRSLVPSSMVDAISANLGGPPGPVLVDGRQIVIKACRGHSCGDKGFLWVDVQAGTAVGATAACLLASDRPTGHVWKDCDLTLGSLVYSESNIPDSARHALFAWITEQDFEVARAHFIGKEGVSRSMGAEAFAVPVAWRPSEKGPSFDCAKAVARIEILICANVTLSRLDLQMSSIYEQVRAGNPALSAREELRELQRRWLHQRQESCAGDSNAAQCLAEQYRNQNKALNNWVPSRKQ